MQQPPFYPGQEGNQGYPQQPSQPQQYPQSPPQQQYSQPFGQPPQQPPKKKSKRRIWIVLGILVGVLVLCTCSLAVYGSTLPPTKTTTQAATAPPAIPTAPTAPTVQPTATTAPTIAPTAPTAPTVQPTTRPTAKPTTGSGNLTATYGTPRLGGMISDFIGKYGTPNDHSDASSFHWFRASSSNGDGLIVWQLTHLNHADSIDVQNVNGNMPDVNSATALCTVYNPDDAHLMKNIPLVDSSGNNAGFDVVYVSASLAREFTADDFSDGNGNNVQPGSFDIQYLYTSDGTQNIDSCSIIPGQEQTHL